MGLCSSANTRATLANRKCLTRINKVDSIPRRCPERSRARHDGGFSLLELMLVLTVSAILATVAVVLYKEYAQTARLGVLDASIASIEPFQEAHRMKNGAYAEGSWHLTSETDESLFEAIGWRPSSTQSADFSLEVILNDEGFRVVAKNSLGEALCRDYPSRESCEM